MKNQITVLTDESGVKTHAVVPYEEYVSLIENRPYCQSYPAEVSERLSIGQSLLKAWRKYKGVKASQIAHRLGISKQDYLCYENIPGSKVPDIIIDEAAFALGLTPQLLTEGVQWTR
ncbi:helix-turn-helix domain-containing protein [Shewanella submarina]|uniref:Helix-turn-helix domain-containing protein n=1 Tax=Shewanella submarina TaxID=2016376 RepID=A0ABV7GB43_9GAMM|nr:helix-turn-helix transcriptional regulator [Shewanella submarina]MCL1038351.1 helix-turn-helix domain-containing protein [Shewanella submarina]